MKSRKSVGASARMPAGPIPTEFYSIKEAAKMLRVSPLTLRRRIADGQAKGLVLFDPFGRGRPLITKRSWDDFVCGRLEATRKEYTPAAHINV